MNYSEMPPLRRSLLSMMLLVYLVVLLVSSFTLLKQNYAAIAKNKSLENKILEAQLKLKEQELNYLKLQVHPHFLFNTLNTLYGHALKKSEETPDMILKLSNLLDYLLYQADKPLVSISSEIEHIKDYLSLEKMRYGSNLLVELDLPENIEDISIAPMLFIPLVENCFKHGQLIEGKLTIDVQLKIDEDNIRFTIINSVKSIENQGFRNGIGLTNLEKRLKLLYPDHHSISIIRNSNSFEVQLILIHSEIHQHV